MKNQSCNGASRDSDAPPDTLAKDRKIVGDAAKIGLLYCGVGIADALFAASMGASIWRVLYIVLVLGVPSAVLFFRPSRIALGVLIAVSAISILGMVFLKAQGGGVIAMTMLLLNAAFGGVFVRAFMAARKLNKAARP